MHKTDAKVEGTRHDNTCDTSDRDKTLEHSLDNMTAYNSLGMAKEDLNSMSYKLERQDKKCQREKIRRTMTVGVFILSDS